MKLAIIGAGWAGMAAAVTATQQGHQVHILEATRSLGGRARALRTTLPDGRPVTLDNGQHILIGAYHQTLALMQQVGIDLASAMHRQPLHLPFPDGSGLRLPDWPAPLDAVAGILGMRAWSWHARLSLLRWAWRWQRAGFACPADWTVADACQSLPAEVRQALIDPLCISALNTPVERASAQVFLHVLQAALFAGNGGSHLLLPRCDLGELFPAQAARWLHAHGGQIRLGARAHRLLRLDSQWQVDGEPFDAVILATGASDAARLVTRCADAPSSALTAGLQAWSASAAALSHEAIATVYAWAETAQLPTPLLALRHSALEPAQFAFDKGQLGSAAGLLAFVVSACELPRAQVEAAVLAQAHRQLELTLQPVMTVVEKRATFACTPLLNRPPSRIAPGLVACGDYVAGPYPATLEGAVRSGTQAVHRLDLEI